jgi:CheY-like chemotaxis protein/HPt (histidine-containing phosphotransfer) domain-containing protein
VVIANNGREAIEALGEDSFDCILMDVQMPEMDGMEATHHIRSMPDAAKAKIPIIALTANALKGDSEKYLAAGMTDYLAKPFDEERLFRVISRNLTPAGTPVSVTGPAASPAMGYISSASSGPTASPTTSKIDTPLINTTTMSADSRLYDLTMVQSVSGGDEGFIKKMVALFIETVPQNVQDLKKAMQEENWEQVGKTAHKLKSTIDSMGIKSIRQEIREVEANAKQLESLQTIPSLVATIDTVIKECIGQLEAEVLN